MTTVPRFKMISGVYNVRASELARDKQSKTITCVLQFLDGTQQTFDVERRAKGQDLFDCVCDYMELSESEYFGLMYADDGMLGQKRWLDNGKLIKRQIKHTTIPYVFNFQVKFYVSDPGKLQEEYTRYLFYLQIRHDILDSMIACPYNMAALLGSYTVQSELGDYDPSEHKPGYTSEFHVYPNQSAELENEIAKLHKLHIGQSQSDAESNYLDKARRLDFYGIDLHLAWQLTELDGETEDQSYLHIELGVTAAGLIVYQNGQNMNTFSWTKIVKISFKGKQFFIQLRREKVSSDEEDRETVIGFNLINYRACKNLWKSCVEHHTFFRLREPKPVPKHNLLTLGSKFRFSGRTEHQAVEAHKRRAVPRSAGGVGTNREFSRSPSNRYLRRTVGGGSPQESMDCVHQGVSNSSTDNSYDVSVRLMSNRQKMGCYSAPQPRRQPSREPVCDGHKTDEEGISDTNDNSIPASKSAQQGGGCFDNVSTCTDTSYDLSTYASSGTYMTNGTLSDGLVMIRIKPDKHGRFGFNIKGGSNFLSPVIVSRVGPRTPADVCMPRLNEGDRILSINGDDVTNCTHEEVFELIKTARESQSGDLILKVRPNVYVSEDTEDEPDVQLVPDSPRVAVTIPPQERLRESLHLIEEGLQDGSLIYQFEHLYRKRSGLGINSARRSENISKNRYRDISPYDKTRVLLVNAEGDYINANYVNMGIARSGILNRYVAAQGPLPNTCADFWQMVWELDSTLIVMLTTKVERGRVKCHQYWPDRDQSTAFYRLKVTCTKDHESPSFAFREFTIINLETDEARHVSQMQYIAWPDHGCPDDPQEFIDFVTKVRSNCDGMVGPTVVHCSAGIGRTGVLILMETAMCLIESNEPIYPLDLVKKMRDQRAMMIQTPGQYNFVCQAILKVFKEGLVQPLGEYQIS